MAISTYEELKAAVANWLIRSDLSARTPEFIALAETQMNRVLRVRRMVARATATISDAYSALPTNYLETISIRLADGADLWILDPAPQAVIDQYETTTDTGQPRFFDVVGDEFRYYPAPDKAYTATLTYYAKLPALGDTTATNWLLTDNPDAYLFGALKEAGPYLRDPDAIAAYSAKYDAAVAEIRASDKRVVGTLRTELSALAGQNTFDIRRG